MKRIASFSVDHDLIDFDAFPLILPGDGKHLLLGAVAQLALPQAHEAFREHGRAARDRGVFLQDLLHHPGCFIMFFSDHILLQDTGGRSQWINSRINA